MVIMKLVKKHSSINMQLEEPVATHGACGRQGGTRMGAHEQLQVNEMEMIASLYQFKSLAAISGALGIKLCVSLLKSGYHTL